MQWGKPNVDQLMEFMNDAYNKKFKPNKLDFKNDPSRDEMLIHFIASMIPNTLCWILANIIDGKRNYFPFL